MATPYVKNKLASGATITKTALDKIETGIASSALSADLQDFQFRFPRVMTNPPTVTITNDTTSTTLSGTTGPALNGVSYTNTDPTDTTVFRPLGVGNTAPTKGSSGYEAYAATFNTGSASNPSVVLYDFMYDGIGVELSIRQFAAASIHVLVNGEYATATPAIVGGTAGSYGNVKITFTTAAIRRITVEYTSGGAVYSLGMWKGALESFRFPKQPTRRLVIAGDSYTGGATSTPISSWGKWAARALGFEDFVNAGLGGSGWLATTTVNSTAYNMANRLTADVINYAPTDVIFALGHNDTSFSNTAIAAQVTSVLNSTRTALPNLRSLTVVGPFYVGAAGVYSAMSTAIGGAAAGIADQYIDTAVAPYFVGGGNVGATTGGGNADVYVSNDGVHPTDPGSLWLGLTVAQAISDAYN